MSSLEQSMNCSLESLFIENFRNLRTLQLRFSPQLNLILGDNGQGKTNLLEAIALSCSLKTMQSLSNHDLICSTTAYARISAQFSGAALSERYIEIFAQGKKAQLNKKNIQSARVFIEKSPMVSFIPHELGLVYESARLRRHVFDQIASSLASEHAQNLKAYDKILQHRNSLLKAWPPDKKLLDTFSGMLLTEGAKIIQGRIKALLAIKDIFIHELKSILGEDISADLSYVSNGQRLNNLKEEEIHDFLVRTRETKLAQENQRKITLFGPHLDDIIFILNNLDARKSASRGQSRALVLALKLAHIHALHRIKEIRPIIILDDIVSELDAEKRHKLLSQIMILDAQAFLSATSRDLFADFSTSAQVFNIKNGQILLA
jgi:DNA replication and repair protein RecF